MTLYWYLPSAGMRWHILATLIVTCQGTTRASGNEKLLESPIMNSWTDSDTQPLLRSETQGHVALDLDKSGNVQTIIRSGFNSDANKATDKLVKKHANEEPADHTSAATAGPSLASMFSGGSCYKSVTSGLPANATLSQEQLRRGAVNLNGAFRFRHLFSKLKAGNEGKKLQVLVMGGSCEDLQFDVGGHTLSSERWPSLVGKWLSGPSDADVEFFSMQVNGIELTSASNFTLTPVWQELLSSVSKYDLVLVAGAVNFPLKANPAGYPFTKERSARRSFDERILRGLLDHSDAPPVLLVEWFYSENFPGTNFKGHEGGNEQSYLFSQGLEWDHSTWEDDSYTFLAEYYEVSMVSVRSALLHSVEVRSTSDVPIGPRFKPKDVFVDGLHPTTLGFSLWAQAVQYALCKQFELFTWHGGSDGSDIAMASRSDNVITDQGSQHYRLPEAIFQDPAHQLALRRGSEASGFTFFDESIKLDTKPSVFGWSPPWGYNNSIINLEVRATLLPLIALEACALLGLGQGPSVASPSNQRAALHTFALEPLRFFGVFHIVLMHELMSRADNFWRTAASFGKYWVQFFFALSGFVLYISQGSAHDVPNAESFVIKRICGVYPAYVIGTVLALSAQVAPLKAAWNYLLEDSITGFLLLDSWTYPYGSKSPDGPAWFVCTLLAFWLCFPHWYRFLHGLRWPKCAALFAYVSTFGLPALYAFQNYGYSCHPCTSWGRFAECPCKVWGPFVEFHPLSNWQTFFFGMCIGRVLQDTTPENVPASLRKIGAAAALWTLVCLPLWVPSPSNTVSTLFFDKGPFLLPIFAMLIFLIPLGEDLLLKPVLMESALLRYLGLVSGHLFLLHWPVRLLVARAAGGNAPVVVTVAIQMFVAISFYEVQKMFLGPSRSTETKQVEEGKPKVGTNIVI